MQAKWTDNKVCGLSLVIIAFALSCLAIHQLYQDAEFEGEGGHATAKIYQLYTTKDNNGWLYRRDYLFDHFFPTYFAKFSYVSGNEGFVTGEANISSETFNSLKIDELVPIKFLLPRPTDTRIDLPEENKSRWRHDEFFLGFCLLLAAFGCFVFWRAPSQ
jgi:hypothetical protein